jgi:hypothetical protein
VAAISLCAATAPAGIIQVGPTRTYTTVAAGIGAAAAGDTIEIDSGTYTGPACLASVNKNNLTIRGVGPSRPVLDANFTAQSKKAIFVISGSNTTIENLEFRNCYVAPVDGYNGAGIRQEGANVTIRGCYFYNNQNGILANATSGNVLIEYSEFNHNGVGDPGQTHNMYINACTSFTLQHSYVHDVVIGHEVKTRALVNKILYNRISSELGNGSRELQLAQGGTCYVVGNVIQQGPNSQNSEIIAYGGEGNNPNPYLYIVNNTIINQREYGSPAFLTKNNSTLAGTALMQNNILAGLGNEVLLAGSGGGALTQISNWQTTSPGFADPANYDYRLTAASLGAINMGTAPGVGFNGFALTPTYEYVHPCDRLNRPVDAAIDIGAYEYVVLNQPPTVNAGIDQAVTEGQSVQLHAAASDPDNDPLGYTWTQTTGLSVTLSGAATANASFTAPTVGTLAEAGMTFAVAVDDGKGGQATDSVNVRVYMLADANRDDMVDVVDLLTLVDAFGSLNGDPNYDPTCDFNNDNAVDVVDLLTLVENFGRLLE